MHQEVDDEHEAVVHQSPRRLSFAMNPDALRLTFSPSICEYESESYGGNDLFGPGGYSTLEDLRLQVNILIFCSAEFSLSRYSLTSYKNKLMLSRSWILRESWNLKSDF